MAWYDEALEWVTNTGAGIGDSLSLGITKLIRDIVGIDSVDENSTEYHAAWWTTTIVTVLYQGGLRAVGWAGKAAVGAMAGAKRLAVNLFRAPGKTVAGAIRSAVLSPRGKHGRFLKSSTVNKYYWDQFPGRATDITGKKYQLDHWLIPQIWAKKNPWLERFVNAPWNLVVAPAGLNSMKGALNKHGIHPLARSLGWALEWGWKVYIPRRAYEVYDRVYEAAESSCHGGD
jgi:hypothetical protein